MYVLPQPSTTSSRCDRPPSRVASASSTCPSTRPRHEISGHFDAIACAQPCRRRRRATSTGTRCTAAPGQRSTRHSRAVSAELAFVAGDLHPASGLGIDGLAAPSRPGRPGAPGRPLLQRVARRRRQPRIQRPSARRTHDDGARARAGPTRASPTPFCLRPERIRDDGFDAQWTILEVNRPSARRGCSTPRCRRLLAANAFGVELYQPVDAYQRAERAVKYAGLFIAFTFMAFFCYERVRTPATPSRAIRARRPGAQRLLSAAARAERAPALRRRLPRRDRRARRRCSGPTSPARFAAGARAPAWPHPSHSMYVLLYALLLSEDYALLVGRARRLRHARPGSCCSRGASTGTPPSLRREAQRSRRPRDIVVVGKRRSAHCRTAIPCVSLLFAHADLRQPLEDRLDRRIRMLLAVLLARTHRAGSHSA